MNQENSKKKISFASRLTPRENRERESTPSVEEIKIGQVFFVTEAGRTTIR